MIAKLIQCCDVAHALNSTHLIQNSPDRKIHMEFGKGSYLRWQRNIAVKDFARNSIALRRTKNREVHLLWPIYIFHFRSA